MPTVRVLGADLYYEQHGQGPALLFAHGSAGNHLVWWQQVPYFRERYTCITIDHPGYSGSGQPTGESWSFVDCLAAFLDELGIRRVSLVGQSMGGGTCLGYTLAHPERVAALVMSSTMRPLQLPEIGDWLPTVEARRAELKARGIHPAFGETSAREKPALHFLFQELAETNPQWGLSTSPPGITRVPLAGHAELHGYATPTLFTIGEEDVIIPPEVLKRAAAAVPGAEVVPFPRSGHSVYFERAEAWNQRVGAFLADVVG